jgi:hypothetical protein
MTRTRGPSAPAIVESSSPALPGLDDRGAGNGGDGLVVEPLDDVEGGDRIPFFFISSCT